MSREFSGMTLRRAKKCIWQQILKATKGRPVNCVYDDWHTGSMSSNATQESSLSAVRMDNIRPPLTENGGELLQRNPILQRPNGAHEFRHDLQETGNSNDLNFKRSFRTAGRSRNQINVQVRSIPQAQNRCDCVFLSAADDQARDDMADPHPAVHHRLAILRSLRRLATCFFSSSRSGVLSVGKCFR